MILAPAVGIIAIAVMLRAVLRLATTIARAAIWLATHGARRQSAAYAKSTAILATAADWVLDMFR